MSEDTSWHGSQPPAGVDPTASVLRGAWRRKSLVALGSLVGLVVASLYLSQKEVVYESSADVLVVRKRPGSLAGVASDGASMLGDRDIPHEKLIKSPLIIDRAVQQGDLPAAVAIGGTGNPASAILQSLSVEYQANMLQLSFRGPDPDACQQVLSALIESYREFLDETYRNANDDTLRLVTQKAADIQDELRKKGDEYQAFHERTPLTWLGKGGGEVYEERLASIEEKRSEQRLIQAELRTRLAGIQTALAAGRDEAYLQSMIAGTPEFEQLIRTESQTEVAEKSAARTDDRELLALMLKADALSETYGPDYPDVRTVERQIELLRRFRNTPASPSEAAAADSNPSGEVKADAVPPSEKTSLPDAYVQLLEQKLDESDRMEETLSKLYEQEHEAARKLSIFQFEDKRLSSDIERAEQFYSNLMAQLQSVGVGKDLGGYTTSVIAPSARGRRIGPNALHIIPTGAFLGFLAGCGLAYLAELSDKSFRSADEVSQCLHLPVIGQTNFYAAPATVVSQYAAGETLVDPSLCVFHAASSAQAEAYRAVRTSLYFSTRGEQHSVFQITSPEAGDGKSMLAANLAISFAQTGERTLLIDADLRKPRMHKLFGIEVEQGLAALIGGQMEVAEAIVESGVPGLQLLPAGNVPINPAELLSQPRFKELIDLVREQYDYVIVDSPPLLAVTDPCVVAPRVDGVLLTVRITRDGRPQAQRARAILAAHDSRVLGVVVNDADNALDANGYGYGYRYRRGYQDVRGGGYHDEVTGSNGRRGQGSRQKA